MSVGKLIADQTKGIDLIVGAHSHDYIKPPYKSKTDTFVVQAMSNAVILAETELILEGEKLKDLKTTYHFLYADKWEEDPEVLNMIQEYRKAHKEKLLEYVGIVETPIGRQYKMERPFDKLVTNLLKDNYDADVAFNPGVSYSITLRDTIHREDVFDLIPHSSKIITLNLTGKQIVNLLEHTATNLRPKDKMKTVGGLLQSSGLSYTLDLNKEQGQKITEVKIGDKPIEQDKTYKVAMQAGMLKGIHNYTQFAQRSDIHKMDENLNDFIVKKLQEMEKIIFPENLGEVNLIAKKDEM